MRMPAPCILATSWTDLIVASYAVDPALLAPFVPRGTEVDLFEGACLCSLVGFMWTRPRLFGCPIPFHGQFAEVNLRFYVRRPLAGGYRRGVVFIREIVSRPAVAAIARWVFRENFVLHPMRHAIESSPDGAKIAYEWYAGRRWNSLAMRTQGESRPLERFGLEAFLLDHNWAYGLRRDGGAVEYHVEHPPWAVWPATGVTLDCDVVATYGSDFSASLGATPRSILVAAGSPVRVRPGVPVPG